MKEYMKEVSVEDAIKAGRTGTLCWDCENAMRGGCCWADPTEQKPVKDWVAEETEMGYRVIACPEFIRGTYGYGSYRTADDYILALEIKVTDQKNQLEKLKNTLWWKCVHRLRVEKRAMAKTIEALKKQIEELTPNDETKVEEDVKQ